LPVRFNNIALCPIIFYHSHSSIRFFLHVIFCTVSKLDSEAWAEVGTLSVCDWINSEVHHTHTHTPYINTHTYTEGFREPLSDGGFPIQT
jgi:hypothetical protein